MPFKTASMKYIFKFLFGVIVILLMLANCSKPKDFTENYLKGKIDGVIFNCVSVRAHKPMPVPGSGGGDDPTLIITGEWPGYSIKLNIYGEGSNITEYTYVFQADKNRSATIWYNGVDAYYAGNGGGFATPNSLIGTGSITIHKIDKKYIKGSFEFETGPNGPLGLSKTVTDGEFYIKRS